MRALYIPNENHTLGYAGNRIYKPVRVLTNNIKPQLFANRIAELGSNDMWSHISRINHTIAMASNQFFDKKGSVFTILPLTTRMISSPGALYGRKHLDYTTDTVPIRLKWFSMGRDFFLSESSQIYLELSLVERGLKSTYSIYNSFRKEHSDATHLSEFHHIEFEGKVSQKENIETASQLISFIAKQLLKNNKEDLEFFLFDEDLQYVRKLAQSKKIGKKITFKQALDLLYRATKQSKYKKFTTKYFGSWEEVKLTSILDDMAIVSEYPLYEIAFYHAPLIRDGVEVGDNSDFIWPYYREIAGSGHRVRSLAELKDKVKKFNLPKNDYKYYLASRSFKHYSETSGFGLGWERLLQGLLKMPFIYSASAFPRVHNSLYP